MYIKRLAANKESFRSIDFEPGNINIILGSKGEERKASTNETVNGVGKTLSIKLMDYCLGSSKAAHKELSMLQDWEFSLQLGSQDGLISLRRQVDGDVFFNEKHMSLTEYKESIGVELFKHLDEFQLVSFRGLISRYLRIPKEAYLDWKKYKAGEEEHISLLLNAYFLGLELQPIIKKINDRDEINKADNSKKYLENDSTIKGIMNGTDVNIELTNLTREIKSLETKLEEFKISEGYNDVREGIDEAKYRKTELMNQIAKCRNTIKRIDDSLEIKLDVSNEKVIEIYKEAAVAFSENMIKSLEEISDFHKKLIEGRKIRLIEDKKKFKAKIFDFEKELTSLDVKINKDLDFIRDKVSSTDYEILQGRLVELKIQSEKMQQYGKVLRQIEYKKANLVADMAKENLTSLDYIDKINEYKKELSDTFKCYVDYIYGESRYSGIDIISNAGQNKIRYEIKPKIQDDGSGGISNVKLFCMDLLIWSKKCNSEVDFLYHDGLLFSEVDPRQCYRMLKLAYKICNEKGMQYIFNMNYDMFDNIKEVAKAADDSDFESYLEDSVRIRLYDDKPESKLLGVNLKK